MKPASVLAIAATAAGWLPTASCAGETGGAAGSEQTITEELKAIEDPTILKRRVWIDSEWNRFEDDSNDLEETLGGFWAWRISDRQDWAVRIKLPFEMHFAGDAAGDSDKQGLGDIKLAAGTALRLSDSWRAGGGIELRTPSGTDAELSDNTWRLQEFGALAWDAAPWLTLSPSFEHNHSVAEQPGAAPKHFLELFLPATFLIPHHWSVTAKYEVKVDFENDNDWTQSAKFQVSKQLDELPLGLSLSVKKPLDSSDKAFQVNFVVTYYFRPE